jgi:hypothetical protein
VATYETWSPDQASIGQLVSRLLGESGALVSEISRLLGAEARWRAADFQTGAVLLACGTGALLVGLAVASGAGVAALALVLPLWAAALVVGALELVLALVLVRAGLGRLRRMAAPPDETLEVIEGGVRALRAEASARKTAVSGAADAPPHRLRQPSA